MLLEFEKNMVSAWFRMPYKPCSYCKAEWTGILRFPLAGEMWKVLLAHIVF